MNLSAEQARRLAEFPEPLRRLLERELAAGNEIIEFSGGHPAAPAGDCVKLARQVTTRLRASGDGLRFRERNSSLWSGEFTDERGFYFILEPPGPPPPEPDMDAIRKAANGLADSLTQFAQTRAAGSGPEMAAEHLQHGRTEAMAEPTRALTSIETATSAKRILHFSDRRPPHEIQFALERSLMTLFATAMDNGRLTMTAKAKVVGAEYDFELRFEAAMPRTNCYSLRVETSWADSAATHHDYYRKTSDSWFSFWTRDFMPANPPAADAGSAGHYQKLCTAALHAEDHLDTVPALQQAIVAAMKRGARFTTSHKEGDTNICWTDGRFVRSDCGDYPDHKNFSSEAKFLTALRQFYDWETSKNISPDKASDIDAWRLILRLLRTK